MKRFSWNLVFREDHITGNYKKREDIPVFYLLKEVFFKKEIIKNGCT